MTELTCVVVGGGYAGINAVKEMLKYSKQPKNMKKLKLVLLDKNLYHLRKVLLFKPAASKTNITIPLRTLFPENVEIIQAEVTKVEPKTKKLFYQNDQGDKTSMSYDILIVAMGSIVRQPDRLQGGITLANLDDANTIRMFWHENLQKASQEKDEKERQRLMTVAVAGAGISGIETSAELAYRVQEDAKEMGLNPKLVKIILINTEKRLFSMGPAKVSDQLEHRLSTAGITILHERRAVHEKDGMLLLTNGEKLPVGLCVWTLGLLPNPQLRTIGLPLTPEGYMVVDSSYRVKDAPGVYSIGDCARIVDPFNGQEDGKTCKEATAQATRLMKIVAADIHGRKAPLHKGFMDFFCFSLGPDKGMAWIGLGKLNIVVKGKLGWKLRKFTWNSASLIK
ncbi:FAD-dependent oxidoreductase [Planococcus sp. N028]|uniref:NADH:ubiquinone reductase (non-electrogenic) n=1 Tax=Planococcus shixiaomingii TaxID=3058393 RepID=A0ABT8N098_9BACL|nr:FAD-dependent oxidoreductase [Planococcus sp. N028]MDN7240980.1 FAD-dependent oxidoreductase [Planococcus sp. N028]